MATFSSDVTAHELIVIINKIDSLLAIVDLSHGSERLCQTMFAASMVRNPPITIFTPNCYGAASEEHLVRVDHSEEHHQDPHIIYTGAEPRRMAMMFIILARRFNWRRFHFVISPNHPTYEKFYLEMLEIFNKDKQIMASATLRCTDYFISRLLCKEGQAKEIAARKATAVVMLLDERDGMGHFLVQLRNIKEEFINGKAFFLIHFTGTIGRLSSYLRDTAPDGLMVVEEKPFSFPHLEPHIYSNNDPHVWSKVEDYDLNYMSYSLSLSASSSIRALFARSVHSAPGGFFCSSTVNCKFLFFIFF